MKHEEQMVEVSRYLLNELSDDDKRKFEQRLVNEIEFQALVDEYREILMKLDSSLDRSLQIRDKAFLERLKKNERNGAMFKWLALASGMASVFAMSAFYLNSVKKTSQVLSIDKIVHVEKKSPSVNTTPELNREMQTNEMMLAPHKDHSLSSVGIALALGSKGMGDIASADSNLFSNISNRFQKRLNNKIHYDQSNEFLPVDKAPVYSLGINDSRNKLEEELSYFDYFSNGDEKVQKNKFLDLIDIVSEQSTNPYDSESEVLRIHLAIKRDIPIDQLVLIANQKQVLSYKLLTSETVLIEKERGMVAHRNRNLKKGSILTYVIQFNRNSKVKSELDKLKGKVLLNRNAEHQNGLFSIKIDSNDESDSITLFDNPMDISDATEDQKWIMGLIGLRKGFDKRIVKPLLTEGANNYPERIQILKQ